VLAAFDERLVGIRSYPYVAPGGYERLGEGLEVFGQYTCADPGPPAP